MVLRSQSEMEVATVVMMFASKSFLATSFVWARECEKLKLKSDAVATVAAAIVCRCELR